MTRERVAVYGGSFNPPHVGHVLACAWALATGAVARVLVVPCFVHPFAKELAPFEDRFAMCALAMGWLPGVEISRVEAELGGESRTLRTLEHLGGLHPGWSMRLLIGADVIGDAPKWHRYDRVSELAPPLVMGRLGYDVPGVGPPHLPDVSSSEVRARLRAGETAGLERLVPGAVLAYVRERGLYQGGGEP
ncbi:MAG TPA: nicotinate (nicotinamide) nucleotide adenylyltransferase [Polyangiaceae bacterium]|nr:nicotinate (nicotinamide) nucleotide adenylyltransferase [Polyangiaceae bacterium]